MKKKFAFIILGNYKGENPHACMEDEGHNAYVYSVGTFEEAYDLAVKLAKSGVGAIELCGAFGKERADKIIELTQNKVAVGYVTHDESQNSLFEEFFSGD